MLMPVQDSILYTQVFPSPAGDLLLGECEGALCLCDWLINPSRRESMARRMRKGLHAVFQPGETPLLQEACAQLHHYFEGERQTFTLPLRLVGTPFQQEVWEVLRTIPYGKSCSYQTVARQIGRPTAVRAVANAIGANPLSLFIPCHRVIGQSGDLTGYAGGLEAKRSLLRLEGVLPLPDSFRITP